jgi:hypothetical protein
VENVIKIAANITKKNRLPTVKFTCQQIVASMSRSTCAGFCVLASTAVVSKQEHFDLEIFISHNNLGLCAAHRQLAESR